jgi:Kef-type K+ transport system membrane component KefB
MQRDGLDRRDEIHVLALPDLAKFAIVVAAIVGVPGLAARIKLPPMVGLLLFGVALGPHVLGFFGEHRPIADFFAELGKLLLMFSAGLEIDIALFRKAQARSIIFGLLTTTVPLFFGTLLGLGFGYAVISAIVVGSLLASHTLLSVPIVQRLGVIRLEPIVVTIGATVLSDTLSLVVFAVCVSMYTTGFSPERLAIQLIEIAIFVPLILIGLSRAGAWALSRMGPWGSSWLCSRESGSPRRLGPASGVTRRLQDRQCGRSPCRRWPQRWPPRWSPTTRATGPGNECWTARCSTRCSC